MTFLKEISLSTLDCWPSLSKSTAKPKVSILSPCQSSHQYIDDTMCEIKAGTVIIELINQYPWVKRCVGYITKKINYLSTSVNITDKDFSSIDHFLTQTSTTQLTDGRSDGLTDKTSHRVRDLWSWESLIAYDNEPDNPWFFFLTKCSIVYDLTGEVPKKGFNLDWKCS